LEGSRNEDVIRCNTGLAGIHDFAPEDSTSG
jgi:hypothetical protein